MLLSAIAITAQSRHELSLAERQQRLEPFIIASARTYGIDARILRTLCFIESRYRTEVVSPKGARGPMQFMPETAARYGLKNPHDAQAAIDAAARCWRDLLKRFGGRVDLALAAYNAGEGAVTSFMTGRPLLLSSGKIVNPRGVITGGIPPYTETQNYVRSAIALMRQQTLVTQKPVVTARPIRFGSSTIASKSFTLDASANDETPSIKIRNVGPSSFIEIP